MAPQRTPDEREAGLRAAFPGSIAVVEHVDAASVRLRWPVVPATLTDAPVGG
jgi:hypothetical protein